MTATFRPPSLVPLDPSSVVRTALPNGLTVLIRRDASAPVVAVVTYVKAGYFDETDDVVGIAHVLEHMFFKGTERRGVGEISRQTKSAGGYLNAHTIYDHTSYYVVLPSSGFVQGLEVQADAYANSRIDARELEKELEVIIQEAKRKSDNPPALATETLYELLHDRHRMRRWRIGREPGLRALTRDALLSFYRNFYRPSNTILSIVGDVDPEEALDQVRRLYGALPEAGVTRSIGPGESTDPGFRCREIAGDITQCQLVMGWRTPDAYAEETPWLDLAATVLGTGRASRLYRAVRERQLAASITAYNYTPSELGVFVIHAETEPDTTLDAARAAWAQLAALREVGPTAHELERARRLYEARWIRRLETMEGQANYLAEWEAHGDWTLGAAYLDRIMRATPRQVQDAVAGWLRPDQASVVIYRPQGAATISGDSAALRRALDAGDPEPLPAPAPRAARPAPATVVPARERSEAGVSVYLTPNGVPLLVRRKVGAPMTSIGITALGGASAEPRDEAGLTTLMARTALKGTTTRSAAEIAEDAEMLGGSVGASVGGESASWAISVPTKHAGSAIELLADVVQHPTFPDEALENERAVAIADARMLRDDMYRFPLRLMMEAAYGDHPYGTPAGGTEETLTRPGVSRLRDWHARRVLQAPLAIALVGDLEPDDAAALLASHFGELQLATAAAPPAPVWPDRALVNATAREKAQTALAIAFPGPTRMDDDRYVTGLIATVASGLGGRFFDELRDRQSLAYTVHAFATERRHAGMFVSYIATSPEKEEQAREGLLREFARLCETTVGSEELARARRYSIGVHAIRQESASAVMSDILDAWLFGGTLRELTEFDAKIDAVDEARMLDVARKYFDAERRVEGIVRGTGKTV